MQIKIKYGVLIILMMIVLFMLLRSKAYAGMNQDSIQDMLHAMVLDGYNGSDWADVYTNRIKEAEYLVVYRQYSPNNGNYQYYIHYNDIEPIVFITGALTPYEYVLIGNNVNNKYFNAKGGLGSLNGESVPIQSYGNSNCKIIWSNHDIYYDGILSHEADINGNEPTPEPEQLGFPIKFRYYTPAILRNVGIALTGIPIKDEAYFAKWDNPDNTKDYNVEIQYKGTYKIKKKKTITSLFPNYEQFTTSWHEIGEVHMTERQWSISHKAVDYGEQSPIYIDLKQQSGYDFNVTLMLLVEGVMRIRYVQYDAYGNVTGYGKWVSEYINESGANVYLTEDDGTIIPSEEYGMGQDVTNEPVTPDILNSVGSGLSSGIDAVSIIKDVSNSLLQLPSLMGLMFVMLPSVILNAITAGIGIIILLRIGGR